MRVSIARSVWFAFGGLVLAWAARAVAADATFIDRNFSSNLQRGELFGGPSFWPLRDGGATVLLPRRPGTSSVSYTYYRLGPNGIVQTAWTAGGTFILTGAYSGENVVSVLDDGSFVLDAPPYRRSAKGTELPFTLPDGFRSVAAAALQADGKLLIAEGARLARLMPDGSIDAGFAASTAPLISIADIRLDGAGRILLLGAANTSARIIRLTATGATDPSFAPIILPGTVTDFTDLMRIIKAVTNDGRIIVAGGTPSSTTTGAEPTYTRYQADGTVDRLWNIQPWITQTGTLVAFAPSGETYVASSGTVSRLTAGPTPQGDPSFVSHSPTGARIEGIAPSPNGKVLVLGTFTTWEGFTTSNLARLDPSEQSAPTAPTTALANIALRGFVNPSEDPLIAGFVVADATMKVLIRVAGPGLRTFGVSRTLANPRLTVFNRNGTSIATNDDWQTGSGATETALAISRAGAFSFATGSRDAALVIDLPAGNYTVQADSVDGTSGAALVEVYRLP